MRRKLSIFLLLLTLASLLAACGGSATNTPAAGSANPAPTTAASGAAPTTAAARPTTAAAPTAVATIPVVAAKPEETGVTATPNLPTIPADAKKGGTLNVANSGSLHPTLHPNPVNADATAARDRIAQLIWSPGMIDYNFTTLQWQLEMAKEVKVDPTSKIFTFTLRPDLKWSDGSPLTVDDFQFAHDNMSKENKENPAANFQRLQDKKLIESFKTDAATATITVTFPKAYARDLAYYFLATVPMPKKVWDGKPFYDPATNPEIKKPTVVSGPYILESYDDKVQAVLKPNPYWYRGKANFEQIIVKPYQPTLVGEALKAGQADVTWDSLPPSQFDELKNNANLNVYDWSGVQNDRRSIAFNTTAAPFNDKILRQAILYTLNRDDLIKLAESGRGGLEYSIIYQTNPYYNPEVPKYPYDAEKGKKLLTDNGYKLDGATLTGKDGQPVKFTIIYSTTDVSAKLAAAYIQQQVKPLGMEVSIEPKDPQAYLTSLLGKKYDASLNFTGGGNFPDPDFLKTFYATTGVFNVPGYSSPRVDEIFATASTELDVAKRKKLYDEVQVLLAEAVPTVILYSKGFYIAANKKVGGIVAGKGGNILQNFAIAGWYFKS